MLALTTNRRRLMLGSAGILGLTAGGGCGGGGDGDGGGGADLEGAAVREMQPDPSWQGEQVQLEFWTFVDAHTDFMIARAEEFNAANDQYAILLRASTAEYEPMHDRLLIALQSGTGAPDLADIEIARFAPFLRGDIPLHPLTDVIDRHRAQLVQERLAPYQLDGVEYGIDYHLGTFVMYYNQEVMEAAGVDVDDIVSWDDYITAGQRVVENTEAMMTTVETTDRFSVLGLMLQNGGGIYDQGNQLMLNHPANVAALQLVSDMVHVHGIAAVPSAGTHHDPAYYEALNAGQYASVWMPQWYVTRFRDFMPDTEGKILVRPLPEFAPGGFISTMGGGTGTAITRQIDEDKLEATRQFLEFAKLTYEAQVALWTELGFDPYRTDVYDDSALTEPDPWFGDEQVMTTLSSTFDRLAPEYTGPRYPEAVLQLRELVAFNVIEEAGAPQAALDQAQQEVEAIG
jgi:arabinooligosaccharide transport system substrate-binding protein